VTAVTRSCFRAAGKKALVIRNGWFSYRWTQIFDMGSIPAESVVLKARPVGEGPQAPFAPPPIAEVVAAIAQQRPDIVFAPHVETSAGIILPDDYLRAVADAVHAVGGLFVLDCVASGAIWVDMDTSRHWKRRQSLRKRVPAPRRGLYDEASSIYRSAAPCTVSRNSMTPTYPTGYDHLAWRCRSCCSWAC
jgi:hypothetical protein